MTGQSAKAPRPVPGIATLAPYKQGKSEVSGIADPIKLSSNESLFGPSPMAIAAYRAAGEGLYRYPDGGQTRLRNAIAEVFSLSTDNIVCGNGSDELICLLIRALSTPDDDIVISEYSFGMAFLHARVHGVNTIAVAEPEPAYKPDVDALLDAVTAKTRMLVIANPNNPMGKYLPADELRRLHAGLRSDILLLIDGAYADYVDRDDFDNGTALVEAHDNVVMTRTFSKLYGLAGLRIGWAYMPSDILDYVQRIRTPFNTNTAALSAAEAAVRDVEHTAYVRDANNRELKRLGSALSDVGIHMIESFTNFYMLDFAGTGKTTAAACEWLEQHGIIPRPVNAGGPDSCLRLTVGRPEDNDAVIDVLKNFMQS